jgi:DNA-binding response OmpR family regulator
MWPPPSPRGRGAGAALTYVTDGEEVLRQVKAGGVDVVLLDMKMPPGDWGGLWVLSQLREHGLTVPVIVLSGEGGQRQTIDAMRLGARDWVDKGAAGRELLERCGGLLGDVRQGALEVAARQLPSPVAHDFGRYATASGYGRSVTEGLRALEGTVKFAALLALAARPEDARGIPGVQAAQFARPSLGTWLSVARRLVDEGDRDSPAATWLAALLPEAGP